MLAAAASLRRLPPLGLAALALLFGAPLVLAPPVLSDDLYRYLWEGRMWIEGFNPYRLAPEDLALSPLRDELWANINNPAIGSIRDNPSDLYLPIDTAVPNTGSVGPPRSNRRQLRIVWDLQSPALIVGQMPVKSIHFVQRDEVDHPLKEAYRHEVPTDSATTRCTRKQPTTDFV